MPTYRFRLYVREIQGRNPIDIHGPSGKGVQAAWYKARVYDLPCRCIGLAIDQPVKDSGPKRPHAMNTASPR